MVAEAAGENAELGEWSAEINAGPCLESQPYEANGEEYGSF